MSAPEPGQSKEGAPTPVPERSSVEALADPKKNLPAPACPSEPSRVDLPDKTVEAGVSNIFFWFVCVRVCVCLGWDSVYIEKNVYNVLCSFKNKKHIYIYIFVPAMLQVALQVMRSTEHVSPTEQTKLTKAAKTSKKKGKKQEETDEESDGSEDEQSNSSNTPKPKAKGSAKAKPKAKAKPRAKTTKGRSSKATGGHDQSEAAKKTRIRKAKVMEAHKETQEDKPPKAKRARQEKDLEEDKKAKEGDQPEMAGKAGDPDKDEQAGPHEPLEPKQKGGEKLEQGQPNTTPSAQDTEADQAMPEGGKDKPEPKKPRTRKAKEVKEQQQTKEPAKRKASTAKEGKSKEKAEKDNQRSRKCCAYSKAYKMYVEMHGELEARKRAREVHWMHYVISTVFTHVNLCSVL